MRNIALTKNKKINLLKYYLTNDKKIICILIAGMIIGCILVIYTQNSDTNDSFKFLNETDINVNNSKPSWITILLKNLLVCTILCCGRIYGKIIPYSVICVNGILWGIVCAANVYILSITKIISLIPHGILEITVIIICASVGVNPIKKDIEDAKLKYIKLLFGLFVALMLASIIESTISYRISLL